jgi:hypothetical protein
MFANPYVTRRGFMRLSLLAAAGVCLGACAPAPATTSDNFYVVKKAAFVKQQADAMAFVRQVAATTDGLTFADSLIAETLLEFERLLPDLPYIGGYANGLTENLGMSAGALALYRVMSARGRSVAQPGELLYRAVEAQATAGIAQALVGSASSTGQPVQDAVKLAAAESQKRLYPGDWVFEFVPGNGTFDYGIDYTECGICKLFHTHGADELTPYLCLHDYPMSQAAGSGLVRTTTLARGGARCDFRFKKGGRMQYDWIPDFLRRSE